ncbi:MAG: glucosamine-6-phosphate deaminase [Candidatus Aphodosoma sp.]
MKNHLSSSISLYQIPRKQYAPDTDFDMASLARFEHIGTHITPDASEGSLSVAREIAGLIRKRAAEGRQCVLGLANGRSPMEVYENLVRMHRHEGLSFANVVVFMLFEYYPLSAESRFTCLNQIKTQLLDHIDIKPGNIFAPAPDVPRTELFAQCSRYEHLIDDYGGIDYQILGTGGTGNIGFNEPGSLATSHTRFILLDPQSRKEAVRLFGSADNVPTGAITMGVGTILKARRIALLAWGEQKADIISRVIEGEVTTKLPASFLQMHQSATVYLDLQSAARLTRMAYPWLVTSCDWETGNLIRRAIVWLCLKTGKPVLKLTDKDYNENGLSELLARYGSAYNVNIKVFNDLQHTITGWPGGKPNADDADRPERAFPFPKRVLVFSPHPDDDVISMGGTIKRLVDQGHEVHICYQTSGNIAVIDDEIIRFLDFTGGFADIYSEDDPAFGLIASRISALRQWLSAVKHEGEPDTIEIRRLKTLLRRGEAQAACRHIGIGDSNIHFLNMPFYETGTIKKGDLTDNDINLVTSVIESLKPHQIYVAGDLADPHGTHRVCLDAVLAAIDTIKHTDWMQQCRVWMYRGAWMEWEIDHIQMAVPLSPEELRFKRNAILKHQSQMESAPFLGNDERLFWQRSEERNRATASLYRNLGLAEYEAIEAFVRYQF